MKLFNVVFFFLFLISARFYGNGPPQVKNGILDLSGWNFERNGILKITDDSGLNLIPDSYDKEKDTASFSVTIMLPHGTAETEYRNSLALMVQPMVSPYNLWIDDKIALSNDYNYISHWKIKYNYRSVILPLSFNDTVRVKVRFNVFDYSKIRIIRDPIIIGQEKDAREYRWWILFREGITEGTLTVVFIITVLLFFFRKTANYSFLMLGLFSFFQALNLIGRGETLNFLSDFPPNILISLQMIFLFAKLTFLNAYFMTVFINKINKAAVIALTAMTVCISVFLIFSLPSRTLLIDYSLFIYYSILTATLVSYIIISLFYRARDRVFSTVVLISTAAFLASFIIYLINYKIYIISFSAIINGQQDTLSYGIIFFILTNTFYLYMKGTGKTEMKDEPFPEDIAARFRLSKREIEILKLLIKRYSYREISDKLFISNKTVETHVYHIYQKTGAGNKQELIKILGLTQ